MHDVPIQPTDKNTSLAQPRPRSTSAAAVAQGRSGQQSAIVWYLALVCAYAALFWFWQIEPVPANVHLVAVILFGTCLYPLARWYAQGCPDLPAFESILLAYALHYSLPVFTQYSGLVIYSQFQIISWEATFQVLVLVEVGIIAMLVGNYSVLRSPLAASLPQIDMPFTRASLDRYLYVALGVGGMFLLMSALQFPIFRSPALGALIGVANNQFYLAIILLAYRVYEDTDIPSPRILVAVLYGAVAFAFALGLSTGLLEAALIPVIMLFIVRWHAGRRFPWHLAALGVLLVLLLNPAKHAFRSLVWFGDVEYDLNQRITIWTDLAVDSATALTRTDDWQTRQDSVRATLSRFDLIHRFAHVRQLTPDFVPYYRGETYTYFFVAYIPRVLWPNKPSASLANDRFDVDYRLKIPGQSVAVGIGLLPESFANFGPWGVAAVMALQGIIFGLLNRVLNGPRSDGGRAIYLSVMVYFLNGIGTSAAILFGALFQQVLANALILRLFTGRFRAAGDPESAAPKEAQPAAPGLPRPGVRVPLRRP